MKKEIFEFNYLKFFKILVIFIPLLILGLSLWINFYKEGSLILGGEGNFFIDFSRHSEFYGTSWFKVGYGFPNVIPNAVGFNNLFLIKINEIFSDIRITNFILIFLLFALPYLSFLCLGSFFKINLITLTIISLLYVINPFSITYLQAHNQWNNLSLALIPLLYFFTLRFYKNNFFLFLAIGIITNIFSFTLYNPPTAVIILSSIFIATIHAYFINQDSKKTLTILTSNLSAYIGFILFNLNWISVLIYSIYNNVIDQVFDRSFAIDWAFAVSIGSAILSKGFLFFHVMTNYGILEHFYSNLIINFVWISFIIIILYYTLINGTIGKFFVLLFSLLLFLSKGASPPFGDIYIFLMKNIPFFYLFKTPTEKFGILLLFLFFVMILIISKDKSKKFLEKTIYTIFFVTLIPITLYDGLAEKRNDGNYVVSRIFQFNKHDIDTINYLSTNFKDERILVLPGGQNYQVMIDRGKSRYTGLDPILNNSHISYFDPSADRFNIDNSFYLNFFTEGWFDNLKKKNITGIYCNQNETYWFGKKLNKDCNNLKDILLPHQKDFIQIGDYFIWRINKKTSKIKLIGKN